MNEIELTLTIDDKETQRHYDSGFIFKDMQEFEKLIEVLKVSLKNVILMNCNESL